jgi:hypothetical protein
MENNGWASWQTVVPGAKLSLKDNIKRRMETKEWIFRSVEKGDIIWLMHESGFYGIGVRADMIDWEECGKTM